ncbi:MAG: TIGR02757 family protein [Bacteroidales bacterium]|nr:TIGR02757 family protein [Bacteroidales bacterium]
MTEDLRKQLIEWAETYNDPVYFVEDPIAFPREFAARGASLQDIEIAAVFAAHLAWGRRAMIVRDCQRLFDEMDWRPYDYIMAHSYRDDNTSLHRTVKWSEIAHICNHLYHYYSINKSLEKLNANEIRVTIFRQKEDKRAANKKINMMRRWLVRDDGKVDLGVWKHTSPADLIMPLDVHVYTQAAALGLTDRRQKDIVTAMHITDAFREIWPDDPVKGDFALFGYGVTR